MPIGLEDRAGGFAQVVKLAELVGHVGQHARHRLAHRVLSIRDHAPDRDRSLRPRICLLPPQGPAHLLQQGGQVIRGGSEQAARQQHLPRHAVPQHPQHLVAHVRLQAVHSRSRVGSASRNATNSS